MRIPLESLRGIRFAPQGPRKVFSQPLRVWESLIRYCQANGVEPTINFPSCAVEVLYADAIDIRAFEKNDFATGGLRKGFTNGWMIEDVSEKFEVHIGHWQREQPKHSRSGHRVHPGRDWPTQPISGSGVLLANTRQ